MTQYEHMIGEVAEASGAQIAIEQDRVAEIALDGTIVLVKPLDDTESAVALFAVVSDEGVDETQMKKALELNLFARGTAGGTIGLFADSLIYSARQPLEGLSAQEFAERLCEFAHAARRIGDALTRPGGERDEAFAMAIGDVAHIV